MFCFETDKSAGCIRRGRSDSTSSLTTATVRPSAEGEDLTLRAHWINSSHCSVISVDSLPYCTAVAVWNRKLHVQLQIVQNAAATVLTDNKKVEHIALVCQRTDFKILLPEYKALNGLKPNAWLICWYRTSRPLRSPVTGLTQCYQDQNWARQSS